MAVKLKSLFRPLTFLTIYHRVLQVKITLITSSPVNFSPVESGTIITLGSTKLIEITLRATDHLASDARRGSLTHLQKSFPPLMIKMAQGAEGFASPLCAA